MVKHLKVKSIDYENQKVILEEVDGEPSPPSSSAIYMTASCTSLVEGKNRHNLWKDGVETGTDAAGIHWALINGERTEWDTLEAADAWARKCMEFEDESDD